MEDQRHDFVVGIFFSRDQQTVMLIEKLRPAWQAGLLNGVGGGIEPLESPESAMIRELREETALGVRPDELKLAVILKHAGNTVWFFTGELNILAARSQTDEKIVLVPVRDLSHTKTMRNIQWLVPMMLDSVQLPLVIHDTGQFKPGDWER